MPRSGTGPHQLRGRPEFFDDDSGIGSADDLHEGRPGRAVLATCHRSRSRGRGVESDEVALKRGQFNAVIAGLLFMAGMRRSEVSGPPVGRCRRGVRFVKNDVAGARRTLRAAATPEPEDRVVPLSPQMVGSGRRGNFHGGEPSRVAEVRRRCTAICGEGKPYDGEDGGGAPLGMCAAAAAPVHRPPHRCACRMFSSSTLVGRRP